MGVGAVSVVCCWSSSVAVDPTGPTAATEIAALSVGCAATLEQAASVIISITSRNNFASRFISIFSLVHVRTLM
jgi:hypothetical protein